MMKLTLGAAILSITVAGSARAQDGYSSRVSTATESTRPAGSDMIPSISTGSKSGMHKTENKQHNKHPNMTKPATSTDTLRTTR